MEPPLPFVPSSSSSSLSLKTEKQKLVEYLLEETTRSTDNLNPRNLEEPTVEIEESDAFDYFFDEVDGHMTEFKDDKLIKEAFDKGIDLKEYAKSIEADLDVIEEEHISDFIQHGQALVDLHHKILSSDSILATMEEHMNGFQEDLGKLGAEIQSLQDQSHSMNTRLKNRTQIQQALAGVLDGLVIPPDMIKVFFEADIGESFVDTLLELNKKMVFVRAQPGKKIRALKDIGPELERLRLKVTDRIRQYLLEKIKSLSLPNTNISIIQQSILIKYKSLQHFVIQRHNDAANELSLTYIQIMNSYYFSKFSKYGTKIQKLSLVIADKTDMIGVDDSSKKGLFGGGRPLAKDKASVFTLGDRHDVLTNMDAPVILAHVAEEQQLKFPYEAVFKSLNRTLMDNASSEYCFDVDFFGVGRKKLSGAEGVSTGLANEVFQEIFESTLKSNLEILKSTVDSSFDAVGILLCIRINTQHQLIMQKRCIPCLESYLNATNLVLWPRLQKIMDHHIESVRKTAVGAGGVFGPTIDFHPHYITRRYAEFASSLLVLNDKYNDDLLQSSLSRLRQEVVDFVSHMTSVFSDRKSKLIFWINNFDLVVSILEKYDVQTVLKEKNFFVDQLNSRIFEYVEEELQLHFHAFIEFIKEMEQRNDQDTVDPVRLEKVCRDFNGNWKNALASMNASVLQSFSNFKNGATVLHAVLKQLVMHYQFFLSVWERKFPPNVKPNVQPVMIHQLVVEIKSKYKSNF